MASGGDPPGGDPPQLPRGLIGRTGTPNAKGARLPSIRGPRDLTLGGVQKKVFVPNIPARRKQSDSTADQPATSKDAGAGEGRGRGRGRGRGGGERGRGRGDRGRGREMNVIQTHSLFEQGPGGEQKLIRRSGSEYTPSGGVRGTSAGARSAPKISIKIEKTDTETKEVLDMLLKDDFVDIKGDPEEDITEQPVKLPLEMIKSRVKAEGDEFTKMKVKDEPMDTFEDVKPDLQNISESRSDALSNAQKLDEVSCADLFTQNSRSDTEVLMFLQLPDTLPGLPLTSDDEFRGKKAEKKEPDKENDLSDKMKGCNLNNFNEGLIGKLVVRKSGRVQLQLGNTYLDVDMGTPCGFLQDLVSVKTDGNSGEATILGHIEHKLVCTPDFEMLLDST